MKRNLRNIALLILLIGVSVLTWSLKRDPAVPNAVFLPEMYYSMPFDPQSPNPNFADGATARRPVESTIPRTFIPFPYEPTPEGAARAGRELRNPFSREDVVDAERGSEVFRIFCQPCHGANGAGDGTVTKFGFPPPPSFVSQNVMALRDGEIFHTISRGKGNMPSLASQVPVDDRWKVILHIRSLQDARGRQQARVTAGGM